MSHCPKAQSSALSLPSDVIHGQAQKCHLHNSVQSCRQRHLLLERQLTNPGFSTLPSECGTGASNLTGTKLNSTLRAPPRPPNSPPHTDPATPPRPWRRPGPPSLTRLAPPIWSPHALSPLPPGWADTTSHLNPCNRLASSQSPHSSRSEFGKPTAQQPRACLLSVCQASSSRPSTGPQAVALTARSTSSCPGLSHCHSHCPWLPPGLPTARPRPVMLCSHISQLSFASRRAPLKYLDSSPWRHSLSPHAVPSSSASYELRHLPESSQSLQLKVSPMREELRLFMLNLRSHEGSELDGYLSQMGCPGALQAAVQPAHGTRRHGDREGSQLSSRVCRGTPSGSSGLFRR